MTKLEKEIEKKLVAAIKDLGGLCLKWICPGFTGVPDRIILLPGGRIAFAELKRPKGSKVAPLQKYWRRVLLGLGFRHYMIYTEDDVKKVIEELKAT